MTNHTNLIERLNRVQEYGRGPETSVFLPVNPDGPEAAQAISTLTAEVETLRAELADIRDAPVVEYLLGTGPLKGTHFGDPPPPGERGKFWWRRYLRAPLTKGEGDKT